MLKPTIVAALTALTAMPAYATTLSYYFEAEFTDDQSNDALDTDVDAFEGIATITGQIIFDDTLVASAPPIPGLNASFFAAPTVRLDQVDLAALGFTTGQAGLFDDPTGDAYVTQLSLDFAAPMSSFALILSDTDGSTFDGTGFPDLFRLEDFDLAAEIRFLGGDGTAGSALEGRGYTITSLTPVPLPASGLLLLAGLAGAGIAAARKRR